MKIGVDVSQLAFPNTGVANYLKNLCLTMFELQDDEFVLFFSSLRGRLDPEFEHKVSQFENVKIKKFPIPQSFLSLLWNKLHIFDIEKFTGPLDIFITSDWTEPPSKAKKASILYDLIVYKYPEETHNEFGFALKKMLVSPNIVKAQKKKHKWMIKEANMLFCISESTAKDAEEILKISKDRLKVIYPGI